MVPEDITYISHTFLSDTHDFYCICETRDKLFKVYNINLDSDYPKLEDPILTYPFDLVGSESVTGFHCRGSSHKEKINLNKQTMVFMLHEEQLIGWPGQGEPKKINEEDKPASNFYYLSDDKLFFMTTEEKEYGELEVEHSKIY